MTRPSTALFLALAFFMPHAAGAGQPTVTLNFQDAEIREVALSIGEITGRNFILDPRVKGKVTMVSARPIDTDAVYATFLAVLQVHGFAAMPAGDSFKIVPTVDARTLPGVETTAGVAGDEIVTQVIDLQNVSAAQLVAVLRPLLPQYAHIAAYPGSNVLILADHAANIERMLRIVRRIDQAVEGDVEVIPLQNATAGEVVRVVTALNQGMPKDAGGAPTTIVSDDRTNSVLISGSKSDRLRIRTLVTHLDTPLRQDGNTQVVYLRYAEAENLSKILTGYVQAEGAKTAAQGAAPAGGPAGGVVSIIPEPDTNALVITAPPKEMRSLRSVIEKLDIRRAQVLVEAIIVELSQEKAAELGVTWAVDGTASSGAAGITNFGNSGVGVAQIGSAISSGTSIPASAIPDGLTLGVGKIQAGGLSFAALLRALAGDATSNILSTPSLLTMDNEEAEFKAGQEVPFLTGQFTNSGTSGSTNPFQTIERKEVGIKLKIKPQINEGDAVFLEIEQEVSSLASTAVSTVDAVTNKRTLSTRVIANDGEIIVLGGLLDDNLREAEQRVPVLGAIPLLGNLFKYRSTKKVKQNLMVFIRPTIINDGVEAAFQTEAKYNYIRDLQLSRDPKRVELMPGALRPVLPEYRTSTATPSAPAPAALTEPAEPPAPVPAGDPLPPPQDATPPPAETEAEDDGGNDR